MVSQQKIKAALREIAMFNGMRNRLTYSFYQAASMNFRLWNKTAFYAWQYGSFKHFLEWKDHRDMYLMGPMKGEL